MNKDKLPEFKSLFEEFKQTEDYASRLQQTSFAPIAKRIIQETLKNEPLKNEHLTGLIQTLKWNTSDDNFYKYLAQNIQDQKIHDEISEQAYGMDEAGYTNAGKTAITTLKAPQLKEVKKFLSDAFSITTISQAKLLTDKFDSLGIPEVKQGIYSPWLHYINPNIFPIINNSHIAFLDWIEMDRKYSTCIDSFAFAEMAGAVRYQSFVLFIIFVRADSLVHLIRHFANPRTVTSKLKNDYERIYNRQSPR